MSSQSKPKIAIVGTGYVGLACAIGFAEMGYSPVGFDIIPERVRDLNRGCPPYHEAGLTESLSRHLALGNLRFVESFADAVHDADYIMVAVGTPSCDDGSCDLSALDAVVAELRRHPVRYPTVVLRSTIPPGTTARIAAKLEGIAEVLFAPEFLREGHAVSDFLNPDRVVVGAASAESAQGYAALFERMAKPTIFTSYTNAELIKCYSNAYLAMKISFANEVANVCDGLNHDDDVDSLEVLRGIGLDRRIGSAFLAPGIGFGGPCFEKDVKSMLNVTSKLSTGRELLSATLRVNADQPRRIVSRLVGEIGSLAGKHIGVWGLAFKAGTDDVRDSLALRIVDELVARGAAVTAYDPAVHELSGHDGCRLVASALEAAKCDALVVLTEWPEFATIDARMIAERVRSGLVLDGRNVLDPSVVTAAGLRYRGVGRRDEPEMPEFEYAAVAG